MGIHLLNSMITAFTHYHVLVRRWWARCQYICRDVESLRTTIATETNRDFLSSWLMCTSATSGNVFCSSDSTHKQWIRGFRLFALVCSRFSKETVPEYSGNHVISLNRSQKQMTNVSFLWRQTYVALAQISSGTTGAGESFWFSIPNVGFISKCLVSEWLESPV